MLKAALVCEASLALFMYIVFPNAIAGTLYSAHRLCVESSARLSASTHQPSLHTLPLLLPLASAWQGASESLCGRV